MTDIRISDALIERQLDHASKAQGEAEVDEHATHMSADYFKGVAAGIEWCIGGHVHPGLWCECCGEFH